MRSTNRSPSRRQNSANKGANGPRKGRAPSKAKFASKGKPAGKGRSTDQTSGNAKAQRRGKSQGNDQANSTSLPRTAKPSQAGKPRRGVKSSASGTTERTGPRPQTSKGPRPQTSKGPRPQTSKGPRAQTSTSPRIPLSKGPRTPTSSGLGPSEPMRIAKAMARAGLCSRREAERWIEERRVKVNGKLLETPAFEVGPKDHILVDGKPLPNLEPTCLWRYHKPRGFVTTHKDPRERPTVFDALPEELPRVISIGRLDYNTEGLLLLTNDGALARHLELPATGWLRRYRVRAYGRVSKAVLDGLEKGVTIEGVRYGPITATLDSVQGANCWLTLGLREGKNREVRKILEHLGLQVNRLIRISYGPFQLLDIKPGEVEQVRARMLADQLGVKVARDLNLIKANDTGTGKEPGKAKPARGPKGAGRPKSRDVKNTASKARRTSKENSGLTGNAKPRRPKTPDGALR